MQFAHDGAVILYLLIAGLLTLILGVIALVLLQRAIVRNMMKTGGHEFSPPADDRPRRAADAPLAFHDATAAAGAGGDARRLLWRHAVAHTVAGLAFAIVATIVLFRFGDMEFFPLRTTVVVWAYAWPTVLILGLLVGRDRRVQTLIVFGYFGVLAIICAVAELLGTTPITLGGISIPGFLQPAFIWLLNAAPSCFLLLFLNRTIRSIGPLVLLFVFILLLGSHVAVSMLLFDNVRDAVADMGGRLEYRRGRDPSHRPLGWNGGRRSGRHGARRLSSATATPPSDPANCC